MSKKSKKNIIQSLKKITTILNKISNLQWYVTGGVALRLHVATKENKKTVEILRTHSDIDLIIFSDEFELFINQFSNNDDYPFFDCAYVGLENREVDDGENHHYSLIDKEYNVEYGIFELIIEDDGIGYVYTNKYVNKHSLEIFCQKPILLDNHTIPVVKPEWLYNNAKFLSPIKNNNDTKLIKPYINHNVLSRITEVSLKEPVDYKTYKQWIKWRHRKRLQYFLKLGNPHA